VECRLKIGAALGALASSTTEEAAEEIARSPKSPVWK